MSFRSDVEYTMETYECTLEEALKVVETRARVRLMGEIGLHLESIADAVEHSIWVK